MFLTKIFKEHCTEKIMEKERLLIVSILLIVVFSSILIFRNAGLIGAFLGIEKVVQDTNAVPIDINYGNIEQMLSKNKIVNDLPEDSVVLLIFYIPADAGEFYDFNTGQGELERSYVIKKGEVREGSVSDPDVILVVHSKYLKSLTNINLCSVIQTAKKNGDSSMELKLSVIGFLWKFRSILKYRKCLGF